MVTANTRERSRDKKETPEVNHFGPYHGPFIRLPSCPVLTFATTKTMDYPTVESSRVITGIRLLLFCLDLYDR